MNVINKKIVKKMLEAEALFWTFFSSIAVLLRR